MSDLNTRQLHWALAILRVVRTFPRLPDIDHRRRAADIALGTALTESNLLMYANRNNPESLALPHDAVGSDHGSVGLFQQQVGGAHGSTANWGTTRQCMDPIYSTTVFLRALTSFAWTEGTNWHAAQRVQGSAFSDGGNYRANDPRAITIRRRLF